MFSFTETLGVDPGSRNLRIVQEGKIIFNEPSLIAVNREGVATGIGESVSSVKEDRVIKPVTYAIDDFQAFEELLKAAIKKSAQSKSILKPSLKLYFAIPSHVTIVERRGYRDSGEFSGAKELFMIDQSVTASIGMGILFDKKDYILVDFGCEKIQMTVFADSMPLESTFLRMGMQKIIDLAKHFLRRNHQLDLRDEEIIDMLEKLSLPDVAGKHTVKQQEIDPRAIEEVVSHYFFLVNDELAACLERISTHRNFSKIVLNGAYFTGGGSAIEFIRKQINISSDLKCHISKTPLLDTINGLGKLIADHTAYNAYMTR